MESSWPSVASPFSCAFSTGFELKSGLTLLKPTPSFLQRGKQRSERLSPSRLQGKGPYGLLVSVGCFPFSFFFFLNLVGKLRPESLKVCPRCADTLRSRYFLSPHQPRKRRGLRKGEGCLFSPTVPQLLSAHHHHPPFPSRVEKRSLREDQPLPGGHGLRP